jgi:hypothetical protein
MFWINLHFKCNILSKYEYLPVYAFNFALLYVSDGPAANERKSWKICAYSIPFQWIQKDDNSKISYEYVSVSNALWVNQCAVGDGDALSECQFNYEYSENVDLDICMQVIGWIHTV